MCTKLDMQKRMLWKRKASPSRPPVSVLARLVVCSLGLGGPRPQCPFPLPYTNLFSKERVVHSASPCKHEDHPAGLHPPAILRPLLARTLDANAHQFHGPSPVNARSAICST